MLHRAYAQSVEKVIIKASLQAPRKWGRQANVNYHSFLLFRVKSLDGTAGCYGDHQKRGQGQRESGTQQLRNRVVSIILGYSSGPPSCVVDCQVKVRGENVTRCYDMTDFSLGAHELRTNIEIILFCLLHGNHNVIILILYLAKSLRVKAGAREYYFCLGFIYSYSSGCKYTRL